MRIWNVADATEARSIILEGEPPRPPAVGLENNSRASMKCFCMWHGRHRGLLRGRLSQGRQYRWGFGIQPPVIRSMCGNRNARRPLWLMAPRAARIQYRNTAMALSADGTRVATVDEETTLRVWEIGTWKPLQEMRGHTLNVKCVALSPDGRLAASGAADGTVRVWDVETGMQISRYAMMPGNTGGSTVYAVAFSPDGALVACG